MAAQEPEQEDILIQMVEAQRQLPRTARQHFLLSSTFGGSHLVHPRVNIEVFKGDLDALEMAGLIYIAAIGGRGTPNYEIAPEGYEYYSDLKNERAEPIRQVEADVQYLLDSDGFAAKHPKAAAKWREAARKLWGPEPEQDLTNIGHLCREAIQEFADELVARFAPANVSPEKSKDINRIAAVVAQRKESLGGTTTDHLEATIAYLDALLDYWRKTSALTQRQEHGGQKEGVPVSWEDARRVVFQTANVMYEVFRAL
jgi:hypothetical protein